MTNLKFRYVYQHKEDFKIADTTDSIWTLEQIAEGEPNNYIDVCLSSSWKVIDINQYTGLKDKNGKEIFEGDILRLYNEEYDNYELFIEVIFNYKSCFWGNKIKNNTDDLGNSDILYNYNLDITEIVGNIYENGELLNS